MDRRAFIKVTGAFAVGAIAGMPEQKASDLYHKGEPVFKTNEHTRTITLGNFEEGTHVQILEQGGDSIGEWWIQSEKDTMEIKVNSINPDEPMPITIIARKKNFKNFRADFYSEKEQHIQVQQEYDPLYDN